MRFPDHAHTVCVTFHGLHRALANGDDDQRRQLTRTIAEQIRFDLGPGWGTKRASTDRPLSKDSIAFTNGAQLLSFDWQHGATREPNPPGEMEDITGQVFVPVAAVNHLRTEPAPPAPQPDDQAEAIFRALGRMEAILSQCLDTSQQGFITQDRRLARLEGLVNELHNRPSPNYAGTIRYLGRVVLRPEPPDVS